MSNLNSLQTPERFSASTAGLSARDKFEFWHDVVCRNVVDLECQGVDGQPFEAAIEGIRLPGLNVWRIDASAHEAVRSRGGISRSSSDSLVLNFVIAGQIRAQQDGKTALLTAGDGALCDADRPYVLSLDQTVSIACVKLPRTALSNRLVGTQRAMAVSFEGSSSLCPMVFGYLVSLTQRGPGLSGAGSEKVARNFTDLVSAMLAETVAASPLPLSEYRTAALLRVKEFVEQNLGDCKLDSAAVAAALKLSPRYINQLLEAEQTSLSRYIWRRRLERTANDLRNRSLEGRSLSVIAMNHGFNDLSHFSKSFRQAFGCSPRDYRAAEKTQT